MTILDQIFAEKRATINAINTHSYLSELKSKAHDQAPTRGFRKALANSKHPVSLIAEVKKASPSQGVIRKNFDPASVATSYNQAGVDCLSVLTDEKYFQGSQQNLEICHLACDLPILRKDFTTHELDVYAARAMGADAILLIVSGLTKPELVDLQSLAWELGLDVLVEVHTIAEAEIAIVIGANLIGVNNRDLHSFNENLTTSEGIFPLLKDKALLVSESSLKSHEDVKRVSEAGARAVLIGTAFCREPDITAAVNRIMGWENVAS
ncbi:MAG: indole-3-glycerol phosphate synthase TrpC [Fimbriimonadaceae bacterium]|nr:MAG: indole-3-glycerol phosphate synthase TrpC [Fimbriimonadaceae bacterium]